MHIGHYHKRGSLSLLLTNRPFSRFAAMGLGVLELPLAFADDPFASTSVSPVHNFHFAMV